MPGLPNKRVKTDAFGVGAQWWGIGAPLTRPTLAEIAGWVARVEYRFSRLAVYSSAALSLFSGALAAWESYRGMSFEATIFATAALVACGVAVWRTKSSYLSLSDTTLTLHRMFPLPSRSLEWREVLHVQQHGPHTLNIDLPKSYSVSIELLHLERNQRGSVRQAIDQHVAAARLG